MGPKAKATAKPAAKAEKKAPVEEKKDTAAHTAGHGTHDIQGSADFEAGVMFQK